MKDVWPVLMAPQSVIRYGIVAVAADVISLIDHEDRRRSVGCKPFSKRRTGESCADDEIVVHQSMLGTKRFIVCDGGYTPGAQSRNEVGYVLRNHAIVVGLHLRWDGVWQRPQHILSRLAQDCSVIVVEEPVAGTRDLDEILRTDGVTVVRPHRRVTKCDEPVDAATLRAVTRLLGNQAPIVWLYTPMMMLLVGQFPGAPLVYDCMDDLASFAMAPRGMRAREALLLSEASLVFTGGRSLFAERASYGGKVRLYASGVDFDFFSKASSQPRHPALARSRRPIFGYVGVVDERIDLPILRALAGATAGTVAVVGPTAKIDPATLPRARNLDYLGLRPYAELPSLLRTFDVALMPFARTESTRSISPTKTLEYLAAGLPVVSTAIPDVVAEYRDVVRIASSVPDFVAQSLAAAESGGDPALGRAHAKVRSWDAIVERMKSDIQCLLEDAEDEDVSVEVTSGTA